ncbi:MAG: HU family DNA-binding protein [Deltaproteobacteria bacterium]|nr:HU family DNA-binding protein [Deltaproteobacteria bacterium]
MRRNELLQRVRDEAEVEASLKAVNQIVQAFCRVVQDETRQHGRCQVRGLGVFSLKQRAARMVRDIKTGQKREVPAKRVVRFRPEAGFAALADKAAG